MTENLEERSEDDLMEMGLYYETAPRMVSGENPEKLIGIDYCPILQDKKVADSHYGIFSSAFRKTKDALYGLSSNAVRKAGNKINDVVQGRYKRKAGNLDLLCELTDKGMHKIKSVLSGKYQ